MAIFTITTVIKAGGKPPLAFAWEAPFETIADLCRALATSRGPILGDKLVTEKRDCGRHEIVERWPTALTTHGIAMIQNPDRRFFEVEG